MMGTLEDRFRIPWPKGARKVSASYVLPFIINILIIILGSISHYLTLITYFLILPIVFYTSHRLLKAKRKIYYCNQKSYSSSKLRNNYAFYKVWGFSTVFYLMLIYYAYVLPSMKISSLENLLFVLLFVSVCACLYIVMRKGELVMESSREAVDGTIRSLESCSQCSLESFKPSSHCNICGACFTLRDHHCLWLNTCIGRENDRWFFAALVFSVACLLYGAQLTFTTVCHPKIFYIGSFEILYPHRCPNAYFDFSSSVMYSAGCYSLLLIACVSCVLLQQVCSVSRSWRHGNQTKKIAKPCNSLYKIVLNWFRFWIR